MELARLRWVRKEIVLFDRECALRLRNESGSTTSDSEAPVVLVQRVDSSEARENVWGWGGPNDFGSESASAGLEVVDQGAGYCGYETRMSSEVYQNATVSVVPNLE